MQTLDRRKVFNDNCNDTNFWIGREDDKYFQDSDEDENFKEFLLEYGSRFKSRWYASISSNPNNDMDEQDDSDDDAADSTKEDSELKADTDNSDIGSITTSNSKLEMILKCQNNSSLRYSYIRYYNKITRNISPILVSSTSQDAVKACNESSLPDLQNTHDQLVNSKESFNADETKSDTDFQTEKEPSLTNKMEVHQSDKTLTAGRL